MVVEMMEVGVGGGSDGKDEDESGSDSTSFAAPSLDPLVGS